MGQRQNPVRSGMFGARDTAGWFNSHRAAARQDGRPPGSCAADTEGDSVCGVKPVRLQCECQFFIRRRRGRMYHCSHLTAPRQERWIVKRSVPDRITGRLAGTDRRDGRILLDRTARQISGEECCHRFNVRSVIIVSSWRHWYHQEPSERTVMALRGPPT